MKDDDYPLPGGRARRRQLEDERTALHGEMAALRSSLPNDEPDAAVAETLAALEQRIESIEGELERITLAAEIERQKDA
ncbi:MAG TPA: hypothetical protein VFF18_09210 [Woeseiaceae bacterium]|nr:hypothetical protein [Woeseiaceae bacterium]